MQPFGSGPKRKREREMTIFDKNLDAKRERIAARDCSIPKMGPHALNLETGLFSFLSNLGFRGVTGGEGTGIIVARQQGGRVFKVEITQVDGPE